MNIQNANRVQGLLGLCRKAGKIASGEFQALEAISGRTGRLVLLSEDCSENTRKRFHDKAAYYRLPIVDLDLSGEALGKAMGQGERKVAVVTDAGFAGLLEKALQENS